MKSKIQTNSALEARKRRGGRKPRWGEGGSKSIALSGEHLKCNKIFIDY